MSTRAIIALPVENGYITAWNWNDGGPSNLGAELRAHFTDTKIINELISHHSFGSIAGPRFCKKFYQQFRERFDNCQIKFIELSNRRYLISHVNDGRVIEGEGPNGFFADIDSMLQCDLNYVYVFENGKWKTYK